MDYQNLTFQFQITSTGSLRLRLDGCGEATEEIDRIKLENLLPAESAYEDESLFEAGPSRDVKRRVAPARERPEEVGELLFDTLFVGRIRELVCTQLGAVARGEARLRLRLALDISQPVLQRLQNLPWELLWYSAWGVFLGLDRRFSLVRSLDVTRPTGSFRQVSCVNCLVATASPQGLAELDVDGEISRLKEVLQGQEKIKPTFLPAAGASSLRYKLLDPPAQILHFAGHGYDHQGLGLVLETAAKEACYLDASSLAEQISDLQLRLVVLNACSTATPSTSAVQPFNGVAQALIRGGVPAVVAMRKPILDTAGLAFAKSFYGRLAAGDPIDAALVEARKDLRLELPKGQDWAIPALFLRGDGVELFASRLEIQSEALKPTTENNADIDVGRLKGNYEVIGIEGAGTGHGADLKQRAKVKVDVVEGSGGRIVGISGGR